MERELFLTQPSTYTPFELNSEFWLRASDVDRAPNATLAVSTTTLGRPRGERLSLHHRRAHTY